MKLIIPTHDTELFASLPADCLIDIRRKHDAVRAMLAVKGQPGRAGEVAALQSRILGLSLARTRQLASDFSRHGWRALWDRAKWPNEFAREILPREFLKHWHERIFRRIGGKTVRTIYGQLIIDWRNERWTKPEKTQFPGYDATPEPEAATGLPRGWSEGNLCHKSKLPAKADIVRAWQGAGAARAFGPQVLTDRKTLEVGARFQVDDYHWNQHVAYGRELVRVHQLGILDVGSGCLASVFFKPAFTRGDGAKDGIKQDHTALLVCAHLFNHGYLPERTHFALEKGTASIPEKMREAFMTFAPGLQFDDAGSLERHQLHGHGGRDSTNPNMKAALESLHHLLTNIEAQGPANTGANYSEQPEHVHGLVKEVRWLLSKVETDEQLALLRLGLLSFDEFRPWARGIIERINSRRNHSLQGFPLTQMFRLSEHSEDWLTSSELLALPEPQRLAISSGVRQTPHLFTARVKQSPMDVWRAGVAGLTRLSAMQACHLAAEVVGEGERTIVVRPRTLQRAYFTLADSRLAKLPEPIVFESRIINAKGEFEELPAGFDAELVFNPLDETFPRKCFVRNAKGAFLGVAMEAARINPNEREEVLAACALQAHRTAERTGHLREVFAETAAQVKRDKAHNRRVLAGDTAKDKQRKRAISGRAAEARNALISDTDTHHDTNHRDTNKGGSILDRI